MHMSSWWVSAALAVALGDPVAGQSRIPSDGASLDRSYRISGVVVDTAGQPLSDVELTAGATTASEIVARTNYEGRFELGPLPPGTVSVRARRLGYEQRVVEVNLPADAGVSRVIVLRAVPQELEQLSVTAPADAKLSGFYRRKQQLSAFGRFFEQNDIRRMSAKNASDLFRNVPGVSFAAAPNGGNAMRVRGCQPMVRLDDQRVPGAELDELVSPSDIAAIEFYSSAAGVPAQYVERGNRLCGVILVWTKTY